MCSLDVGTFDTPNRTRFIPSMATEKSAGDAFSDRLRQRCSELGLKQADLAKATGVSKASVNRWFNGVIPRAEYMIPLRKVLKASHEWLYGEVKMPLSKNPDESLGMMTRVWKLDAGETNRTAIVAVPWHDAEEPDRSPLYVNAFMVDHVENAAKLTAIRAPGNSARPRINADDVVVFNKGEAYSNGDFVVIRNGGVYGIVEVKMNAFTDKVTFVDKDEGDFTFPKSDELPFDVLGPVVSSMARF